MINCDWSASTDSGFPAVFIGSADRRWSLKVRPRIPMWPRYVSFRPRTWPRTISSSPLCLGRREGAGEHSKSSVLRPARWWADHAFLLLLHRHGNLWHPRRRRWRQQRERGRRGNPGERRRQSCSRDEADEPARLRVHQSSGEGQLWEGRCDLTRRSDETPRPLTRPVSSGDAGGAERHRRSLRRQSPEERRDPAGRRRGLHHDGEEDSGAGQETPLPDAAVLLLPD